MASRLMPEILKLSVAQRIALADEIYESFDLESVSQKASTMLPGQKGELERRIKKYTAHPELLVPAAEVLAKLKSRK